VSAAFVLQCPVLADFEVHHLENLHLEHCTTAVGIVMLRAVVQPIRLRLSKISTQSAPGSSQLRWGQVNQSAGRRGEGEGHVKELASPHRDFHPYRTAA
jgi:hypothetical protein